MKTEPEEPICKQVKKLESKLGTKKYTPELLKNATEEIRRQMKEGHFIPLVRLEKIDESGAFDLELRKNGYFCWNLVSVKEDGFHRYQRQGDPEQLNPENFAQRIFQSPNLYETVFKIWIYLNAYCNVMKMDIDWIYSEDRNK